MILIQSKTSSISADNRQSQVSRQNPLNYPIKNWNSEMKSSREYSNSNVSFQFWLFKIRRIFADFVFVREFLTESPPLTPPPQQQQPPLPEDFTNLARFLKAQQWKKADEETLMVILNIAGIQKKRNRNRLKPQEFPQSELKIIDTLWQRYSDSKFGLCVQKRIWLEIGQESDLKKPINTRVLKEFAKQVGWYENDDWNNLNFSLEANKGHLPSLRFQDELMNQWKDRFGGFLLRIECS